MERDGCADRSTAAFVDPVVGDDVPVQVEDCPVVGKGNEGHVTGARCGDVSLVLYDEVFVHTEQGLLVEVIEDLWLECRTYDGSSRHVRQRR